MSQLYTSAFRKHIETIYPASYKSTIERLNREHRIYRIVIKTADRSCSGSYGDTRSPEESLWDGFPEGTIDEGLENKAAGPQPVATVGMVQLWVTREYESPHLLIPHPMNPATRKQACKWY